MTRETESDDTCHRWCHNQQQLKSRTFRLLRQMFSGVFWRFYFWSVPGLKFFGAQGVGDVLDGVTQTVGVVVRGVDTPAERRVEDSEQTGGVFRRRCLQYLLQSHSPRQVLRTVTFALCDTPPYTHHRSSSQTSLPLVSCPMMWRVLDPVGHRVHLPVLHHHLHPERGLSL